MNMSDNSEVNTVVTNENEEGAIEMKDATTKENGAEDEARPDVEKITGLVAAAGIKNSESRETQRRHYSEADEDITTTANVEGEADVEKIEIMSAAGIETKIENYESKRTQRRHFSEANADEMIDISDEEISTNIEGVAEAEADEEEIRKTEEAAQVEKKIIEDYEGVRTQRKHFPGSTTSNIFR